MDRIRSLSYAEMIKLSSVWCLVSGVWCLVSGVCPSVRSSSVSLFVEGVSVVYNNCSVKWYSTLVLTIWFVSMCEYVDNGSRYKV